MLSEYRTQWPFIDPLSAGGHYEHNIGLVTVKVSHDISLLSIQIVTVHTHTLSLCNISFHENFVCDTCMFLYCYSCTVIIHKVTTPLHNTGYTCFHSSLNIRSPMIALNVYRSTAHTDGVGSSPDLLWAMVQIFSCLRAVLAILLV